MRLLLDTHAMYWYEEDGLITLAQPEAQLGFVDVILGVDHERIRRAIVVEHRSLRHGECVARGKLRFAAEEHARFHPRRGGQIEQRLAGDRAALHRQPLCRGGARRALFHASAGAGSGTQAARTRARVAGAPPRRLSPARVANTQVLGDACPVIGQVLNRSAVVSQLPILADDLRRVADGEVERPPHGDARARVLDPTEQAVRHGHHHGEDHGRYEDLEQREALLALHGAISTRCSS